MITASTEVSSWKATGYFSGLAPGTYIVAIRDRAHAGCVMILNPGLVITEPAALSAVAAGTNVTCNGANNGIITITNPQGGYGTYAYSINGGSSWQSSETFSNLAPGTYDVRIRDAANPACSVIINASLVITQPAALTATTSSSNVTCYGASDGRIIISSPSGGYGTYEYSINGGIAWQASGSFTGLAPGYYNVQIRDAANPACVIILNSSMRITEPAILAAMLNSTNVTCNGSSDGTITVTGATGGYGTYEYTINAGSAWVSSGSFTGLGPGTYNVQIRDAVHTACVIILNPALVITGPALLSADVTATPVSCFGSTDGRIVISDPAGGSGTYLYSVNGGTSWQGSGTFNNLPVGSYDVRIRDAAAPACIIILNPSLAITQPAVLHASITSTDVTCFGGNDGTITISSATGGYGTYEFSINGGGSWQASGGFTNLTPGSYNILIRDAAHPGCIVVLNNAYAVTQPAMLTGVVSYTMVTCNGTGDGSITISSPTGGYGTYEYSIDGGATWQSSGTFHSLPPSAYSLWIRDASHTGCTVVLNPQLTITEPAPLTGVVSSTNVTCNGSADGTINISFPGGGYGTWDYSIDGGTSWQATGYFSGLAPGTYIITIRDRAHAACVVILNPGLVITEPAQLAGAVGKTDVTCFGANNGTITITNPSGRLRHL